MAIELYISFVIATAILIVIPGPVVSLVIANSIAHGTRPALLTVAGSSSAIVLQLALLTLGMTSFMLLMADWFELLRWAGVAYLLYLGIRLWRAPAVPDDEGKAATRSPKALFLQGFVVSVTNPKSLVFYAAFFPQFIDPAAAALPQLALLCATFLTIAACLDSSYALLGGRLRHLLRSARMARLRNRITGTLMIGAGIGLALARRQ